MRASTIRIDQVTADLEPGDKHYQIYGAWSQGAYIEPARVTAEFDHEAPDFRAAVITATVTGQAYRSLNAGPKATGPRRSDPPDAPSTWEYPSAAVMPGALLELLGDLWLRRHTEKEVSAYQDSAHVKVAVAGLRERLPGAMAFQGEDYTALVLDGGGRLISVSKEGRLASAWLVTVSPERIARATGTDADDVSGWISGYSEGER